MSEIKTRWNGNTPPFFKRIIKYASVIAWGSGVLAAGVASLVTAGVAIPVFVPIVLGAITAMSTTAAATAKLATDDPEITKIQYNNTVPNNK